MNELKIMMDQDMYSEAFDGISVCLTDITVTFGVQPPFAHNNRQKLQEKIIKDKVKLPAFLTSEAHNLLKGVSVLHTSIQVSMHVWILFPGHQVYCCFANLCIKVACTCDR